MFVNSVHEQCPNSDLKQCTVTKLGWVHSAHTQNPGRAHTARAVPMSWALLRAHPAQVVSMLGVHWSRHAQAACPRPSRDIVPRSRPPEQLSQVATSTPCRDLPSGQLKPPRSRPQNGVAIPTSKGQPEPCRDIKSVSRHHSGQSRPRHQNQVATLLEATLCRDINFYVATSFPPTVGFPGRDTKTQVVTSHTATHVATSN